MNTYYEVYIRPEKGPSVVQERDEKGRPSWLEEQKAIDVAKNKKILFPHMDFTVHRVRNRMRKIVFSTNSEDVCY